MKTKPNTQQLDLFTDRVSSCPVQETGAGGEAGAAGPRRGEKN